MKVHKYVLAHRGTVHLELPEGAKVLLVANQYGNCTLWAEVDQEARLEVRAFECIYTGFDDVPEGRYIGSTISMEGAHVTHVYEVAT